MINFRIIARAFSQVLIIEGLFMIVAALVSWFFGEDCAGSFLYSAIITVVTGILAFTPLRNEEKAYGTREGYIITTGIWIIFSLFGTLPLMFSGVAVTFHDAFFESVSGFTTTGATIFTDIDTLPRGIIFWRSLTQWIGGIAIILLSLYVLPLINTINVQLATTDFSGTVTNKIHPRVSEAGKRLVSVYGLLTFLETILLLSGGLPFFDALCYSLSTLSTGGFTSSTAGATVFSTPYLKIVLTIFMVFAGTNPAIFYHAFKGKFNKVVSNEFLLYLAVAGGFSLAVAAALIFTEGFRTGEGILAGFLHAVSITTTTGFYTSDFNDWGPFLILVIFALMFTGGMSGSASGGLKIIRLLIIARNSRRETRRLVHPNAYLRVRVDGKKVPDNIINNLLILVTISFITVCGGTLVLSLMDYDLMTSFSTTASMLSNIGPGIGTFGPFENYSAMPAAGKWFLSLLMLMGRLEFFAVIILATRSFYKR